ncbi:hypothetical protein A9502_31935 [Klebsiella pneumoniae]|nr:hypothetical protein A9502_31935 [Klebsiella pneumoniae]
MLLCCFLMLNSTFVMFRAMSAISKGSAKENRSEISLIVLATLGIASPFIVAMITINALMLFSDAQQYIRYVQSNVCNK